MQRTPVLCNQASSSEAGSDHVSKVRNFPKQAEMCDDIAIYQTLQFAELNKQLE